MLLAEEKHAKLLFFFLGLPEMLIGDEILEKDTAGYNLHFPIKVSISQCFAEWIVDQIF